MVALRSLVDETVDAWATEQKDRLRLGLCIICAFPIRECVCSEYETLDERPLEGSDDPVYGV
jgi:hypothetical protein